MEAKKPRVRRIYIIALAGALIFSSFFTVPAIIAWERPGPQTAVTRVPPLAQGLNAFPAIHININPEDILRYDWQYITVSLKGTDADFKNTRARIRGRGNASWNLPKRPFRLRLDNRHYMLGSCHSARHWTFIPNHADKSLMRNYSAYYLASLMDGMYVAPFANFIDVYMNGIYQGVYMISIQVSDIREGRVNLQYNSSPELSEFLIEFCMHPTRAETEYRAFTVNNRNHEIRYPSGYQLTPAHVEYVRNFFTNFENILISLDTRALEYIHMPSFVDYYIIHELYKTPDISFSSVFMQIRGQGDNRRIEMGPIWDVDTSAGNAFHQGQRYMSRYYRLPPDFPETYGYSPQGNWVQVMHRWYRYLMQMPEFRNEVVARWNEVRDVQIRQTINHIEYMSEKYQAAFERNFRAWPIHRINIHPNPREVVRIRTFRGQVDYLIDFLEARIIWLDSYFNS